MRNGFQQDVNPGRGSFIAERKGPLRSGGGSVKVAHEEPLLASEATPFLMSVTEAAKLLGWGRTKLYHAIQRGYFTAGVVHVGTSISISRPALFRWLDSRPHRRASHFNSLSYFRYGLHNGRLQAKLEGRTREKANCLGREIRLP